MVTQLKTYGIWTKLKAVYPFVGGSASSHKFNLKDPRDIDAAYRLVFSGGWTHSNTGALPNGTNAYADTYLTPSSTLTSPFLGYYSRSNTNTGSDQIDMGSKDSSNKYLWVSAWYNGSGFSNILARNSSVSVLLNGGTTTDSRGWYWTNKVSTTAKLGKNSTILTSATDTQSPPSIPTTIGKINVDAGAPFYTNRETAFSVIADGMSDTDTTNFYTAVQTFQTTLGRQVGVPIVADTDAQAFLNAVVITDSTQASAITTLVTDLKSANIWTKLKAVYPFVGGTATSHKFNLKDPRDLDAAYRLVFNGGWTHSTTGALPNGTTAYADTKFNAGLSTTSNHLSYYSRTSTVNVQCEIGLYDNTAAGVVWQVRSAGNFISGQVGAGIAINYTTTNDARGFWLGTKRNDSDRKVFLNSSSQGSNTLAENYPLPSINVYLGARNIGGTGAELYSNKQSAFASIGDGLTDAEALAFYTAVQKYQTSLGRQV